MAPLALDHLARRFGVTTGTQESVGQAAARLGTTARMLRYREGLGLVAPSRTASRYRMYGEEDLLAAALGAHLEDLYGVSPAALAFALRVLSDIDLQSRLRLLGGLLRRPEAPSIAALDYDQHKAERLLGLAG
jgi:DNA-binding transcriptional MerR regulator